MSRNVEQIFKSYEEESWSKSFYNASGTLTGTTSILQNAELGGDIHYITDISASTSGGGKLSLLNGTAVLFNFVVSNTYSVEHEFKTPLKSSAGTSVTLKMEGNQSDSFSLFFGGYRKR